jgi:hypothetical protein
MRTFNVLIFKNGKVEHYDVLPYFRNSWKERYNKEEKEKIKAAKYKTKRMQLFKEWVIGRSMYMFWSRCEWEMLIGSWPYGSKRINDQMKEFMSEDRNLDDYHDSIVLDNIITADMEKIDVHKQIEMNIDTIVNILYQELKLDKYDLGK